MYKDIITPILVKWLSADRERVKLRSTTSGDDELVFRVRILKSILANDKRTCA